MSDITNHTKTPYKNIGISYKIKARKGKSENMVRQINIIDNRMQIIRIPHRKQRNGQGTFMANIFLRFD